MAAAVIFRPNFTALFFFFLFSVATSDELQTLLSIKSAFQSSATDVFDTWNADTPLCTFAGITCASNGAVAEIELSRRSLAGSVPFDLICSLESLEKISLGFNKLSGKVAGELDKCVGLKYLDLGNNFFTGSIPEIPSLNRISHLYMNRSGFSGRIPWDSIVNMINLEVLSLGDNSFDESPVPEGIVKLTRLNWLYLSNCSLVGEIPAGIGNLTELTNLELSMNNLSGEIPPGISMLKKLWQLELYWNHLTGKFPVGFGNLSNLQFLDASLNNLTGDISEIRYLNKLVSLQLFYNQFSGQVPAELGEFKNLIGLSLYGNRLTGPLPLKLGSWAEFDLIDVSENFFTGPIPPEMCKQGKMRRLLVLQNNFTGEIPESYGNCTTLQRFRVSKNSLSGVIPSGIWGLPNLDIIDIRENGFEGSLNSGIGNAKALAQLFLGNNKLSGDLPPEISGASALVSIDLSNNQFSGEIPATIGDLKKLDYLHLSNNKFSGSIPDSLGSCVSLSDIIIAQNSLTGKIPPSLGSLPTLTSLNVSGNKLSGQIPETLSSLKLNLIDFSNNQLTGPIPESLSVEAYNGSFTGNSGLCSENIKFFRRCSGELSKPHNLHPLLFSLLAIPMAILISIAYFLYLKKKSSQNEYRERSLKEDSWKMKSFHLLSFTEEEILDGIKQENLIGKGGSGSVYRVVVRTTGKELAVKHIWNSGAADRKLVGSTTSMLGKQRGTKSKEFEAEVQTLSSIRHVNVVKLYCSITSEDSSLLVYEYLPNGSLWERLHGCRKAEFGWPTRYEVAVGGARGLEYLHHCCDRPVIHRDVKSSNILLDQHFKPRIADFGLAKIIRPDLDKDSSHLIAGTHGYIAPEYGYTHKVNEKSDVYSFGVVLMELVSGKSPIEQEYGENNDIVGWVGNKLKKKESVLSIIDSSIQAPHIEDAVKVLKIAIMCTSRLPSLRPSMRNVVKMLEDAEPCKLLGIIVSKECDMRDPCWRCGFWIEHVEPRVEKMPVL
ncbi:PREDICTED: receptor-like protein kinase HAIKU2 [Ipomoea nil]|uniref:receptor-like protein kinase HAIKU2 n=1 Tax=Ipomoea nil TaxID=35883 RepID=UPI000901B028|nr:PREDICTED: receptor-like protein kinase HAIKU2 [Ipomoea nil]